MNQNEHLLETRAATLALRLRKVSAALHDRLKHKAEDWERCRRQPCAGSAQALQFSNPEDTRVVFDGEPEPKEPS